MRNATRSQIRLAIRTVLWYLYQIGYYLTRQVARLEDQRQKLAAATGNRSVR